MPSTPIPFNIALHCHPTNKPYGQSFKKSPNGKNNSNPNDEHSIWYDDSPNTTERLLQTWAEMVKFRQADLCSLGTDFDGIIHPVNGDLTAEGLNALVEYVERDAYNYMDGRSKQVLSWRNQISSAEIVQRIFSSNAEAFINQSFV